MSRPATLTDDAAEQVALAMLRLAVTIRDEGPDAVLAGALHVLDAAGGDPCAALAAAAALIRTDQPVDAWWTRPSELFDDGYRGHGTHTGYNRHQRRGEYPCPACCAGERDYQHDRYVGRLKAARAEQRTSPTTRSRCSSTAASTSSSEDPTLDFIDEIAVQEAIHGRRVALNRAEVSRVVETMTGMGYSAAQIADHLGTTERTVQRRRAAA